MLPAHFMFTLIVHNRRYLNGGVMDLGYNTIQVHIDITHLCILVLLDAIEV